MDNGGGVSSNTDSQPRFYEMRVSLPHDVRLAATVRGLAVQAARYAGCADSRAEAFGASVEEIVRGFLEDDSSPDDIPIVLRVAGGPLHIQIATRTITLDV